LLELGVNAVELLPVFEFDELEFKRFPNPRDHMVKFDNFLTHNALHIDQWSDTPSFHLEGKYMGIFYNQLFCAHESLC